MLSDAWATVEARGGEELCRAGAELCCGSAEFASAAFEVACSPATAGKGAAARAAVEDGDELMCPAWYPRSIGFGLKGGLLGMAFGVIGATGVGIDSEEAFRSMGRSLSTLRDCESPTPLSRSTPRMDRIKTAAAAGIQSFIPLSAA